MSVDYFIPQNNFTTYGKNSFLNNDNNINISPIDNIKTLENDDDIAEVPVKEKEFDYLQKFRLEKENNPFHGPKKYSLNTIRFLNNKNIFGTNLNYDRPISGGIPSSRKNGTFSVDKNVFGNDLYKRNIIGQRMPEKKVQSKYHSVSENKNQFIQRFANEENFGIPYFTGNYNLKANYGPIDSNKGKRKNSFGMPVNNMNNFAQKIYRSPNINVVNGIYLNQDQNTFYDGRKNRFLNNKVISNFNNNTINVTKFKNNFEYNNKLVTNFDVINRNKSPQNYQHNQNINTYNNYTYNNQNNYANQRLSTAEFNTNNNIQETATVTKIFSSRENEMKKNVNNELISPELDNLINKINRKTEYLEKLENLKKNSPEDNHRQALYKNSNNNNILTQEEINQIFAKESNQFGGQKINAYTSPSTPNVNAPNTNIKEEKKYSIRTNQIVTSNSLNTQKINELVSQDNNIKQFNQPESARLTITNDKSNDIFPNSINFNKQLLDNNNIELIYSDFDGSGILKNYNGCSLPGKNYEGKTKTNQDSFVFTTNINNIKDFNIFGVLDGHGPDGHFVSEFASNFIPNQIINNPEIKSLSSPEEVYKKLKENNYKIINQAFVQSDIQLKTMQFDIRESGSTCCLVIHIGKHIICANTGDSRAIVAYDQLNDLNSKNLEFLTVMPLSNDNKPENNGEINRILMAGGVVEKLKNEFGEEMGPYRVWVKGKDYPGLAMSRSIGDLYAKSVGVIPNPVILEYEINESTKYIIVCSDGVWEFLDNETVVSIGKKYYLKNDAVELTHDLISLSYKEWSENDKIIDDITAVVAFF